MTTKCSSDARQKEISSSKLADSIKIGPWGGPGGNQHWSFKAKVAITEIIITHGIVVDSISFTSIDENGKIEHSEKFGGGGGKTEKVLLDWPGEYLTSISGTCSIFYGNYVVQSLCFYTNQTRYGPFGYTSGSPFNFPMEDGVIIGFHGRGWPSFGYVDAIGVYVKPFDDLLCGSTQGVLSITNKPHISLSDLRFFFLSLNSITSSHGLSLFRQFINQSTHWKSLFRLQSSLFHGFNFRLQSSLFKESSSKPTDSIKIGPWGGPGGNQHWSFKAKVAITEIMITHGIVVDSISFTSIDENGKIEHSEKFGGGGGKTEKVLLDWPREYLTSISGTCNIFYGNYVVQSLCFYTNQTRYGPFGCTSGSPFNFPMEDGVIIGFHGCGWPSFGYVDAIGVYVKPFEDLFCGSIKGVLSTTKKDPSYNWENPTKKDLWGGNGGKEWNYQPNDAITEIKVHHGKCIDSISFKSKDGDGNWRKYGGTGGKEEPPFQIDWPRDYLASIRGTYNYSDENKLVIQSLYFTTSKGLPYGPFGEAQDKEAKKFEFSMGEWIIVGLYGRESTLIDALGIYAKPYASISCPPSHVQMLREEREYQPAHFLFKVESYSQLLPNEQGLMCESYVFDVAGYKWKLILYPHGDDTCDGKGHISMYLAILESNQNTLSVCVDLKFFVFNQNTKKYLAIRDAKGAVLIFNKQKTKQGFSQLLSLDIFKNPSNGYLVNDCCTFGVELLVIRPSSHVEEQTLTSVRNPKGRFQSHIVIEGPKGKTYCWQIKNFLKLNKDCIHKYFVSVGGIKWELCIYPKGDRHENMKGNFLSLYLRPLAETRKIHVIAKLRVLVPHGVKSDETTLTHQFEELAPNGVGYPNFMPLTDLYEASNEYLKDGTLTVQVKFDEITIRY